MGAPGFNDDSNNFNDILERCIHDVQSGLITFDECVAQYPQYPELANLLELALVVNELPRPQMSAAFTARTQQRLQARLRQRTREVRSTQRRPGWFPLQRALAALLIIAVVVFVGGAGLVRASANSVPSDTFLYSVKRAVEGTKLFFSTTQTRPTVLYDVAEARLSEIDIQGSRGQPISEQFMSETVESVAVALISQTDPGAQTRLTAEAISTINQAQALGVITTSLAQQSLAKLQASGNVFTGNDQQATATSEAIAQSATALPTFTATQTFTPTPTTLPSLTPTSTFTPTSTNTPAVATTAPANALSTAAPTLTFTPTFTATLHLTATPTPPLGPGPARVLTGIPTNAPQSTQAATSPATQAATDQQTAVPGSTEAATLEATLAETSSATSPASSTDTPTPSETVATEPPTATPSDTPTFTPSPKPTNTPTSTPSFTPTFTPTNTATPLPTATPTATPNGLPDVSFKQPWQQITFHDCPPEGQGGDPALNQTRNRVDDGNYQQIPLDTLTGLPWPADAQGKRRDQWSQAARDEIGRSEGLPLTVEGFIIRVRENDPEAQNCNSKEFKTWQVWLVSNPGNDQSKALIVQISPRVRDKHAGWTLDKLNSLASAKAKIRVSGWLMFNEERADELGKSRASLWEIHPVMQVGVSKNNQWVNLDDLQPQQ